MNGASTTLQKVRSYSQLSWQVVFFVFFAIGWLGFMLIVAMVGLRTSHNGEGHHLVKNRMVCESWLSVYSDWTY